ncbi:MAG: protein kinase [Phycisphaerales bacterium]|nr:protein kinase [Phycisphaerales bacterium]
MTPDQYNRMQEIVHDLLSVSPADLDTRLHELCGGDHMIESGARKLILSSWRKTNVNIMSDEVIEAARRTKDAMLGQSGASHAAGGVLPDSIGDYRVIREIGRGGMGVVFECEQTSPQRRVAVKVVDALRSASILGARLAAEAQIQGSLQHPGIAQVFDAGMVQVGRSRRPYYSMELISGRAIHAYAEDEHLTTRERMDLIARVADAMGHAHERGVIHRDLKPENILVTAEGQPKILDFGIARIVGDAGIALTTLTHEGQVLGTLAYMAPEQLEGAPDAITTAADVYGLGAITYELLAGFPPLQLAGLSIASAIRAIEREDPPTLHVATKAVDRDVETIVMKCLSREPERRYPHAGALADDIRRYLSDRPILSRPPSRRYRASKFIKRNKLLVGGVSATTLALTAGLIASSIFAAGQRTARIEATEQGSIARRNELEAVRGVLSGATMLNDGGRRWDAVRLMQSIAPESRGWEWNHLLLPLFWNVEGHRSRSALEKGIGGDELRFLTSTELLQYSTNPPRLWNKNVLEAMPTEIPINTGRLQSPVTWAGATEDETGVQLEDGRIGALNVRTGAFTKWHDAVALGDSPFATQSLHTGHDPSLIVRRSGSVIQVFRDGHQIYREDTGYPPEGMNWNAPLFDPEDRWVYLPKWGNFSEIIAIDAHNGEEVARAELKTWGPSVCLSPDGSLLYAMTLEDGIEVLSAPALKRIGRVDPDAGFTQSPALSPDGDILAYTFRDQSTNQEMLRLWDLEQDRPVQEFPIGATHLHRVPFFSPDGRLLACLAPDHSGRWLIDLDHPAETGITRIGSNSSYIYQLAVSPDGSLLASSAPEGDLLLWDLQGERVLARIDRHASTDDAMLMRNMNAILVFTPDGRSLIFSECDPESRGTSVVRLDLDTGEREHFPPAGVDEAFDLAANLLGDSAPIAIQHHAALLKDRRILQGTPSLWQSQRVVVRRPGEPDTKPKVLCASAAAISGGVAVHPGGRVYAAAEVLMIRVRDADTDQLLFEIVEGTFNIPYGMTYSPDGSRLAIGTEDGRVLIFDTEFYQNIASIKMPNDHLSGGRNYIYNLVWTPDGKRLITCTGDAIRILESERMFIRDWRKQQWEQELTTARSRPNDDSVSDTAARVVRIERWAGPVSEPPK